MPAYIMFILEKTLDSRPIKVLTSNRRHVTLEGPEVQGVLVAEFPSLEVARAWNESPAHQAVAQRQFDSWLADMEYCDRF